MIIIDKILKALNIKKSKEYCAVIDPSAVFYDTAKIINSIHDPKVITVGANTHIRGELFIFGHGGIITIGDYCYIGEHSKIWSDTSINIGNRVLISHNVNIFDNNTHPLHPVKRHEQFKKIITSGHPPNLNLSGKAIVIEDDVLISCMVIILKGVTIGKGAVIGAGSVVTKDIPPYHIAIGNPAKVIRKLTEEEIKEK